MCGIAGAIGLPSSRAAAASERMLAALSHRGPDDRGTALVPMPGGPPIALAHARLSILDLSPLGHQPMRDPHEGGEPVWITYNGEVFNFESLRDDLVKRGEAFRSRSDTEVILRSWRVSGRACVEKFRGMFALCLVDPKQGVAWLCRDRFGIKPLYLYRPKSGGLLFSSEVRSLLAAGEDLVPPNLDPVALESYLARGAVSGDHAIVAGVEMLPPGTDLIVDAEGREVSSRRYWRLPLGDARAEISPPKRDEVVATLHDVLRDAVRLRLLSDVPLGAFLSSGVDSSSVVAVAKEVAPSDVRTLCVGLDIDGYDESRDAAEVARAIGTAHETLHLSGDAMLADIDEVFAAMDQPTIDGFNTYYVSRAARRAGLTVALSGLGGDEIFGGYGTFREVPRILSRRERLGRLGVLARAVPWVARLRRGSRGMAAYERYSRPSDPLQTYLLFRETLLPRTRRALLGRPQGSDPRSGLPVAYQRALGDAVRGAGVVNQVSFFESEVYMGQMLLRDSDVFSMAVGLELRVPLLDHVLAEKVAALPGSWKIPGAKPKSLLIDAVGSRLPASTYQRRKRGFTFPWASWLRGPLRARARDALHDAETWRSLGLHADEPARLWRLFEAKGRQVTELQIMELWVLREFARRHRLRA